MIKLLRKWNSFYCSFHFGSLAVVLVVRLVSMMTAAFFFVCHGEQNKQSWYWSLFNASKVERDPLTGLDDSAFLTAVVISVHTCIWSGKGGTLWQEPGSLMISLKQNGRRRKRPKMPFFSLSLSRKRNAEDDRDGFLWDCLSRATLSLYILTQVPVITKFVERKTYSVGEG